MTTVTIHQAKAHLSALIKEVADDNERIIISRYGKAVAELISYRHKKRTVRDKKLADMKIIGDLTAPTIEEWNDV